MKLIFVSLDESLVETHLFYVAIYEEEAIINIHSTVKELSDSALCIKF